MRNSLQAVGLSLVLWFGLGGGLLNAAILNNTEIGSGSILNKSEIADELILEKFDEQPTINDGSKAIISRSDQIMNDESFTNLDLTENRNLAFDYEAIPNQTAFVNIPDPTPTSTTSLALTSTINEFSESTFNTDTDSFFPEHGTFAMLLIGIGLLGLTARRRKDVT